MAFDCVKVNFSQYEQKSFWYNHEIPFIKNYFEIIKSKITDIKTSHFWVVASFMEVSDDVLNFIPEQFEQKQIHVFYSGENKEGNILLIPKEEFLKQMNNLKFLRDYQDINYHKISMLYPDVPKIFSTPSMFVSDYNSKTEYPYHWVVNKQLEDLNCVPNYFPSYWHDIKMYTWGETNDINLVPYKKQIKQFYDFELIQKFNATYPVQDMDIIFISYDEPLAQKRYDKLKSKFPRAKWCKNIKGQTNAYHTAARMSDTDYFFAVFPKIDLVDSFNFSFQPDRLKHPAHYIFDCYNTVIDLTYGHDGVILYNKKLVLETLQHGLDFTLSAPHQSINILSAENRLEDSPELAWRTAFREVIKLKTQVDTKPTVESKYRLNKWLTLGHGKNAEWVYVGAQDAVKFIESKEDLMKSYDFDWLKNKFEQNYS